MCNKLLQKLSSNTWHWCKARWWWWWIKLLKWSMRSLSWMNNLSTRRKRLISLRWVALLWLSIHHHSSRMHAAQPAQKLSVMRNEMLYYLAKDKIMYYSEFLMLNISTRTLCFHVFTYICKCCFIFSCCLHFTFVLFAVLYCAALCVINWLIDWLITHFIYRRYVHNYYHLCLWQYMTHMLCTDNDRCGHQ